PSEMGVSVSTRLGRVRGRLGRTVVGQIAQTAAAAAISWELALQLPDHGTPFFAPMAAAIALNAEFGRRGRQAIEMMTVVSVGIVLGAALVAEAGSGVWQILVVTFVAWSRPPLPGHRAWSAPRRPR